jgi:hypothetical protein
VLTYRHLLFQIVFDSMCVRLRTNIINVINEAREKGLTDLADRGVVKSLLLTYETLGFEKRDRSHLFQRQLEVRFLDMSVSFLGTLFEVKHTSNSTFRRYLLSGLPCE